jgi:copper chaperone
MAMIELEVKDMSCGHCVGVITKTIKSLDPSATVEVDLPTHRVKVETGTPAEAVMSALAEAGYPAVPGA